MFQFFRVWLLGLPKMEVSAAGRSALFRAHWWCIGRIGPGGTRVSPAAGNLERQGRKVMSNNFPLGVTILAV